MADVGMHLGCAVLDQHFGGLAQRSCGVADVIDDDALLACDIADHDHFGHFTGLFAVLKEGATPGPYASLAAAKATGAVTLNYGVFFTAIVNFLIIGFCIFIIVRWLNKLMPKPEPAPAPVAAAAPAPAAAPAAAVSADAGKALYDKTCFVCHAAGVAGAPKFGDKNAWAPFVATGIDAMVKVAISGKGAMPPKGGSTASDEEFRAAVQYMVDHAK